jgi:hypothetical protein
LTGAANSPELQGLGLFVILIDPETGEPDESFYQGNPLFIDLGVENAVPTTLALNEDGNMVVGGATVDFLSGTMRPSIAVIMPTGNSRRNSIMGNQQFTTHALSL